MLEKFTIEGWFPPAIFSSSVNGKRYAVCGHNWVEVGDMTIEEVMKGYVCIAKDSPPKLKVKAPTKKSIMADFKAKYNKA